MFSRSSSIRSGYEKTKYDGFISIIDMFGFETAQVSLSYLMKKKSYMYIYCLKILKESLFYLIFCLIFLEKPTWATMCEFMCRDHSAFLQYIHFQEHYAGFKGWRYPDGGRSSLPWQWTNFGAVNITGIAFSCKAINHIMSFNKHAFMFCLLFCRGMEF